MIKKAIRDAFGEALEALGKENKKIVVVSGDLEDATRAIYFKRSFPERFFNLGIAEQDLLGTAVGLSLDGLIPFACSFATFITNRAYGILRISICYNKRNVKIIGYHAGLTVGQDGATAQCLEDIAITRVLPNLTVIVPCDGIETKKATREIIKICGPVYMRLSRAPSDIVTEEDTPFKIGKANIIKEGKDLTIITCGIMVAEALKADKYLREEGINSRIINMHTIKPLDEKVIIESAEETKAIVTAEEHQINGGLGSAVADVLIKHNPVPLEMVAVKDTFGESGLPEELLEKYNINYKSIISAAKKVLERSQLF